MNIKETMVEAYQIAKEKGFHPPQGRNMGELLMLVTSELGEAMEAHRKGKFSICGSLTKSEEVGEYAAFGEPKASNTRFETHVKDTFEDEIADAVIRLFDLAEMHGMDLEWHIRKKMDYNKNRPHLNGKKY